MKPAKLISGIAAAVLAVAVMAGLGARPDDDKILLENVSQGRTMVMPVPPNRSLQVCFIHSLYGGYQIESFLVTQRQSLALEQVKFESYDALLYYTGGSHAYESREGSYWIIPSDYQTDSINFIIPQSERNFSVTVGDEVLTARSMGKPGEIIKIYVGR